MKTLLLAAALVLPARAAALKDVSVLTVNIQEDAKQGVPAIAGLIKATGADVVGLQECGSVGPDLAALLGFHWRQIGGDTVILSRYAIEEATPAAHAAIVRLDDGRRLIVFDLHLYYKPYQPYQLLGIPYEGRFIKTEEEAVQEAVKARGQDVADVVKELASLQNERLPLVLLGDFNEPSHLDWTEAAAAAHRHPIKVAWPATTALAGAGLKDAYRTLFPDEMAKPGYTWTPTTKADDSKDHHDRIDFILYRGNRLRVTSAKVVGEDKENADVVVAPYPTDHRAVLAAFAF